MACPNIWSAKSLYKHVIILTLYRSTCRILFKINYEMWKAFIAQSSLRKSFFIHTLYYLHVNNYITSNYSPSSYITLRTDRPEFLEYREDSPQYYNLGSLPSWACKKR